MRDTDEMAMGKMQSTLGGPFDENFQCVPGCDRSLYREFFFKNENSFQLDFYGAQNFSRS